LNSFYTWKVAAIEKLSALYDIGEAAQLVRFLSEDLGFSEDSWTEAQQAEASSALDNLLEGQPLAYVTGKAWFYNLELQVSPDVLIPRPETEELVELILNDVKSRKNKSLRILDIGTGSGCIALALKANLLDAMVYAIDKSEQALTIAAKNAVKHKLEISFQMVDFLNLDHRNKIVGEWDIIVSNPPYIPHCESTLMGASVLRYEPHLALFTNDGDGMEFYEAIAHFSNKQLDPLGVLYLEINEFRASQTLDLLTTKNFNARIHKDLSGKDRMISANFMQNDGKL